ncbi:MAG: DegT/DnrJ/EryC1/StrS aminotransferase family protein [Coxiellaceae bacterium]|jgi:dTDP-4-amino-4,6-dideoxygalactose transaminase|nr:DegT/DnrJ/EryC1/StrS aminotransferase family protein [Coxiellaceae bacterium]
MRDNFSKWPVFSTEEVKAVSKVLKSGKVNYWTGSECKLFEKEFAEYIGMSYGISLANGTVALELALRVLDIGSGDEVIVPARTFIASASCIIACGARPIVSDIDVDSQNITINTIKQVVSKKTKAIIIVHLAGWPCDMDPILNYAKQRNLKVIEDCAQAHGACYKGKYVGSFGDAAAFSFCQDKIITTGGEGGMLLLRNRDLYEKAWAYKDHGKNLNATLRLRSNLTMGFKWTHDSFGTNWRMTEMQAAIGRIQLRKLDNWVEIRRCNADILTRSFQKISALRITKSNEDFYHSYYKYYVFIKPNVLKTGVTRDKIVNILQKLGVPCFVGSCPEIYLEKAFINAGLSPKRRFKIARELGETSLVFLVHHRLMKNDMIKMSEIVKKIMNRFTK